jgi:hypothetical protein
MLPAMLSLLSILIALHRSGGERIGGLRLIPHGGIV